MLIAHPASFNGSQKCQAVKTQVYKRAPRRPTWSNPSFYGGVTSNYSFKMLRPKKRSWLLLAVAVIRSNSEQRGLGIWSRLRKLCLPETRKLIYIRMGWRLRPLRVLWIWGIKHNGFHVGLSFTSPPLERGTQSWEQIWFIPRLQNCHVHTATSSHSAKHTHTHTHTFFLCWHSYKTASPRDETWLPKLSELKCLLSSPQVHI